MGVERFPSLGFSCCNFRNLLVYVVFSCGLVFVFVRSLLVSYDLWVTNGVVLLVLMLIYVLC